MATQQLTVLGDSIHCGQHDCDEIASVMLRQVNQDGSIDFILYCDDCWLSMRRGYMPLTAYDATQAIIAFAAENESPPSHDDVEVH